MKKYRIEIFSLIYILIFTLQLVAQDTICEHYSAYILPETIKKHLSVLASDSLEGRETSMPGMEKAAKYVSGQFSAMGIPPCNKGSYYQVVPLILKNAAKITVSIAGKQLKFPDEYYSMDAPAFLNLNTSEILFVGYGIVDSASGWNDYLNTDVKGKTIVMLDGEPLNKKGYSLISKNLEGSKWRENRQAKIKLAREKNVAAILFISGDFKNTYERYKQSILRNRFILEADTTNQTAIVVYISPEIGDQLLLKTPFSIASYEKKIAAKRKPIQWSIPKSIIITNTSEKAICRNVLGYIEGDSLKEELVIITAHLDHLGKREDKIYYGADDDGSGSASIINIAEAFERAKKEGHGPKRSILIMTFTGEEKGLLGSEYYIDNPVFPLKNTVVDLNIDMIGRVDTFQRSSVNYTYIIGSDKLSTQLHAINENVNKKCCNLELDYKYNDPSDKLKLYYRSDHYNFAKNNIPVIFYFTGIHEDYHKPTDTIDKIDFEKTAKIAKLVFSTAWELANRKERIVVDVVNDFK